MLLRYLEIPELGEGVDDDTEDNVQTNGGEEDEEGYLVNSQKSELHK